MYGAFDTRPVTDFLIHEELDVNSCELLINKRLLKNCIKWVIELLENSTLF